MSGYSVRWILLLALSGIPATARDTAGAPEPSVGGDGTPAAPGEGLTPTLTIDILDRFGGPVPDAHVCVQRQDTCEALSASIAHGSRFTARAAGAAAFRAEAPGFETKTVEVTKPATTQQDWRLRALSGMKALVTSFDTRQERTATLTLYRTLAANRREVVERRNLTLRPAPESTSARFEDLPPGDYTVVWDGPDVLTGDRAITVTLGRQAEIKDVRLRAGASLEGFVRDDLGVPVPEAAITLRPSSESPQTRVVTAKTDRDGHFSMSGIATDTRYSWRVRSRGHITTEGSWGGETRLEIALTRAQRVVGRVVDPENRAVPGAKTWLYAREKTSEAWSVDASAPTDREGRFVLMRSKPGMVRLLIDANGFLPSSTALSVGSSPAPGGDVDLADLILERGRTLRGYVTDAESRRGLASASVIAQRSKPDESGIALETDGSTTATREDGSYELSGVPAKAAALVRAAKGGYAPSTQRIEPGSSDDVDFQLGHGGRIAGRVCAPATELAETVLTIGRSDSVGTTSQAQPDAQGAFVKSELEPGRYTVARQWRVSQGGTGQYFGIGTQDVLIADVASGATTRVEFGCDGLPLSGRAELDGRPLKDAYGWLQTDGSASAALRTDAAGRFAARVPVAGLYHAFLVSRGASSIGTASCFVPAGGTDACVLAYRSGGQ